MSTVAARLGPPPSFEAVYFYEALNEPARSSVSKRLWRNGRWNARAEASGQGTGREVRFQTQLSSKHVLQQDSCSLSSGPAQKRAPGVLLWSLTVEG